MPRVPITKPSNHMRGIIKRSGGIGNKQQRRKETISSSSLSKPTLTGSSQSDENATATARRSTSASTDLSNIGAECRDHAYPTETATHIICEWDDGMDDQTNHDQALSESIDLTPQTSESDALTVAETTQWDSNILSHVEDEQLIVPNTQPLETFRELDGNDSVSSECEARVDMDVMGEDEDAFDDSPCCLDSSADDSDAEKLSGNLADQLMRNPGNTNLSVGEILVVVHAYVCRHKMSNIAGSGLLKLMKGLFPEVKNSIPSTWHGLQEKLFATHIRTTENKVCRMCKTVIEEEQCGKCGKRTDHYTIVHVSFEDQLQLRFKDEAFVKAMDDWHEVRASGEVDGSIRSVADGSLYRSFVQQGKGMPYCLTWKLFIDSIPMSKSSTTAATPVFLMPNEVALSKRKRFTILAGLWVGDSKPPNDLLLERIVQDFNKFHETGVEVTLKSGETKHIFCTLLSVHADLPAKAQLLNMNQYNGKYSCVMCNEPGETFKTAKGGSVHIYPYGGTITMRTENQLKQDALEAQTRKETVNGIKGLSTLAGLQHFKITEGVAIDYMHQVCLGIFRTLMKLWLNTKHHKQRWYCGKKSKDIDARLLAIHPPSFIARRPRSVSSMKHWKASEYRHFLLYYLVPCMDGILPSAHLQHAVLLSNGVFLCTKSLITQRDLQEAGQYFTEFVALMETLYSKQYLTLNVHSLLHQTHMVQMQGGLHENSCFDFEDMLGCMKKLVHGTRYMHKQIVNNILAQQMAASIANSKVLSQEGLDLHNMIASTQAIRRKTRLNSDEWELLGGGRNSHHLVLANVTIDEHHVQYARAACGKRLFTSIQYTRSTQTVDYCVQYEWQGHTRYGLVNRYLRKDSGETLAVVEQMEAIDEPVITGNIVRDMCQGNKRVVPLGLYKLIPLGKLVDKCIYVHLPHISVVVHPPNHYERD